MFYSYFENKYNSRRIGVDEMEVEELGVDEMGSKRSGKKSLKQAELTSSALATSLRPSAGSYESVASMITSESILTIMSVLPLNDGTRSGSLLSMYMKSDCQAPSRLVNVEFRVS